MKKQNLFSSIRAQIVANEIEALKGGVSKSEFIVRSVYPERIIVWLTTKARAFKVAGVERDFSSGMLVYKIRYKDVNTYSDFLALAYEIEEDKYRRYMRRHEFDHLPIVEKTLNTNDKYRYELECHNYDYANREYLDKADSCTFELFVNELGYDSYHQFACDYEARSQEYQDEIQRRYREFYNEKIEELT